MTSSCPKLIAIYGPTASGKSVLAEAVSERLDAQLINADAFMVYQGLDIGTNKPKNEADYVLLDLVPPTHSFGVGEYIRAAEPILTSLFARGKNVVLVGGTGFYLRALTEQYTELSPPPDPQLRSELKRKDLTDLVEQLKNLDPRTAETIDIKNPIRVQRAIERILTPSEPIRVQFPPFDVHKFGIVPPTEALKSKIIERTRELLLTGWKEEVESLLQQGVPVDSPGFRAIGYHSVIGWIEGKIEFDELVEDVSRQTWQYARRQLTWNRKEPNLKPISLESLDDKVYEQAVNQLMHSIGMS
ncbi:MAG: tRNA (adenosine(37)-N6)-dimethylallyltransferase MiaA [Armatimonadetes bacterium]|nr:tRNA (adenosine(37)-N6)-dimethylallyltransferase MiaA [Armatimonadota bacterium]